MNRTVLALFASLMFCFNLASAEEAGERAAPADPCKNPTSAKCLLAKLEALQVQLATAQADIAALKSQLSAVVTTPGPVGPAGPAGMSVTGPQGNPGVPGPQGLSINWRGAWSSSAAYAVNDAAAYNGSAYLCILVRSATATTPDTDSTHWNLLASKGDVGPAGLASLTTDTSLQGAGSAASPLGLSGFGKSTNAATATTSNSISQYIGTVLLTAGPVAGGLPCNGQLVSRTQYASLFNIIGTTYGAGDGQTTFGIPNLKAQAPNGMTYYIAFLGPTAN